MDVRKRKCKDSAENIENKEFSCADSAPGHLLDSDRRSNRNRIKNKLSRRRLTQINGLNKTLRSKLSDRLYYQVNELLLRWSLSLPPSRSTEEENDRKTASVFCYN